MIHFDLNRFTDFVSVIMYILNGIEILNSCCVLKGSVSFPLFLPPPVPPVFPPPFPFPFFSLVALSTLKLESKILFCVCVCVLACVSAHILKHTDTHNLCTKGHA
jgi:hypothetical protein